MLVSICVQQILVQVSLTKIGDEIEVCVLGEYGHRER